ncbi:hypothetical protein [Pseudooceanicola atlanticus]|uniref:Energy transducer TonB n=1 Tax=Pseudooceanicola atlanticus TaxID=1461694 RepID=A0A0A0EGQ4_9RHOB|nr:hypothetical protein [Pseudooceanicola atlanticus]KGM49495.1 hypothetical protein ATO9_05585 [Pseudooceanicola atlanticus]
MHVGHIISGTGHLALIGWLMFGGFAAPPEDTIEVTDVALISPEEFAALTPAVQPPGATDEVSELPQPAPATDAPQVTPTQDTPPEQAAPAEAAAPEAETAPERPQIAPPQAEVADTPPEITPPSEDTAVLMPEQPAETPRSIPRVAPRPVLRPNPDVATDEVPQTPTAPTPDAAEVQPEAEEAAPEEATTQITPDATPDGGPPKVSKRPPTSRPVRTAAAEPEPEPTTAPTQDRRDTDVEPTSENQTQKDAINSALERALAGSSSSADSSNVPQGQSGPPLTSGEKDALRVAVSSCWNTGSLSTEALRTTVVVSVSMTEDARPRIDTIRMVSSSGGSNEAARQAFEAARRAIIRCGTNGYGLPVDKYGQWRDIEMTFNPEKMRIK